MARETGKGGGRGQRGSDSKGKRAVAKKSGWVKPDGTPLRKRKGDYFPDAEIEKKKPGGSRTRSESYKGQAGRRNEIVERDSRDKDDRSLKRTFNREDEKRPYVKKRSYTGGMIDSSNSKPDRYSTQSEERVSSTRTYKKDSAFPNKPAASKSYKTDRKADAPGERRYEKKPFEKKRVRYADKDHSVEMRGRFDKGKPKKFAGPHRERKNHSPSDPLNPYQGETIRLNRYIANAGICSRREADDLITAGVISINGEIVSELGTKVFPGDVVKFHDQTLKSEKHVYVLLNKPKDYITTTDDPQERKTVMNLVKDAGRERIVPVGRLDRNTTGLLIITNDGELTKRLTHPSYNIRKIYQVELDRSLTQADMIAAAEGVELEDGVAGFDEIHYSSPDDKNIVGVELHSGKNRVVRRIFEALGYQVKKLDRTVFAGITKKDLPRGRWRFLTEMEVNMLKMLTGKKNKS